MRKTTKKAETVDSKKGRGTFETDKLPVVTLVRRSDGRVRFLVREDLPDVDEEIADYGDETVIRCTDQYSIYDGIDEYDWIDGHLAINHDDHYVVGDVHTNNIGKIIYYANPYQRNPGSRGHPPIKSRIDSWNSEIYPYELAVNCGAASGCSFRL